MTVLEPLDMRDAEKTVALANTPIFLARRLRENPAVRRALTLHGAQNIFQALEEICGRTPETLADATEVYFYLVALSYDVDLSFLRRANTLIAPNIKWYKDVAIYLVSKIAPVISLSVTVPARPTLMTAVPRSASNTSTKIGP